MNGGLNNRPGPTLRQLNDRGELVHVNDAEGPNNRGPLFCEPAPLTLLRLSAPVSASKIANRLLNKDYQPNIERLRTDIACLRAQLNPDPGGCLERNESVKVDVFPCSNAGEIRCAYSLVVMRSVYEANIITHAGITVKEALVDGVCELNTAALQKMVRTEEFYDTASPLCLCIAPATQLTIPSDLMDHHVLALQRTCPLDHHEHRNYVTKPTPQGHASVDSSLARRTGLSLEETCWTRVREAPERSEGAISDTTIELSVSLDSDKHTHGASKVYSVAFRVTRWPGDTPDEGPYIVLQNIGVQPVFMGLFPRVMRQQTANS